MASYVKTFGSYVAPELTHWMMGSKSAKVERRWAGLTEIAAGVAMVAYMFRDKIPEGWRVPMALVGVCSLPRVGQLAVGRTMIVTGVLGVWRERENGAMAMATKLGTVVLGAAVQSKTVHEYVETGFEKLASWLPPFDGAGKAPKTVIQEEGKKLEQQAGL